MSATGTSLTSQSGPHHIHGYLEGSNLRTESHLQGGDDGERPPDPGLQERAVHTLLPAGVYVR